MNPEYHPWCADQSRHPCRAVRRARSSTSRESPGSPWLGILPRVQPDRISSLRCLLRSKSSYPIPGMALAAAAVRPSAFRFMHRPHPTELTAHWRILHEQSAVQAARQKPFAENGVDDGARTHDSRIHNPGLYQLSYVHQNLIASLAILARLAGVEPATADLEGRCSIQLSYRRKFRLYSLRHPWRAPGSASLPCVRRDRTTTAVR